jgi:hypothetical protein
MRGPIRIGLLAISVACMFALTGATAFGDATDELRSKKAPEGALLRDVNTTPKNQPDAAEFVNNGNVVLETSLGNITCTEIEFGTTVLRAKATEAKPSVELAIPFGVAEGDNCTNSILGNVPTYFDTLATGPVGNAATGAVATVTVADNSPEATITATLHNLKFSQNLGGKFCTGNLDGLTGTVTNEKFVSEEKTPNLNVQFTGVKVPVTNGEGSTGCPTEGKLTANFFLETPSTTTDEAWFES